MELYLGLDIGTTNIKAGAYDRCGRVVGFSCCQTPSKKSVDLADALEYDVEELFLAACGCIRKASSDIKDCIIRSISVSSFAESGVPLDSEMRPLSLSIMWYDVRTLPQSERIKNALGEEHIFKVTGQISSYKFGISKFLWFKENHPELFALTRYWSSVNDYIIFRLCGERIVDYSIAARTMAFDISKLCWYEDVLDFCGFSSKMFSQPVAGGVKIGELTAEAARLTGLDTATSVVTAGHDHSCAAVGAGTVEEGGLLYSMGTSEVSIFALEKVELTSGLFNAQCSVYPHCSKSLYRVLSSMQACGASLEWFLRSFGKGGFDWLDEAAKSAPEDESLVYLPFIRGTMKDPRASGAFAGIRDRHGRENFAKALIDGLCCESAWQTDVLSSVLGITFKMPVAVGGPTASEYLMERKSGLCGRSLAVSAHKDAACFGAAALGMIGMGDAGFEDITALSKSKARIIEPKPDPRFREYQKRYGRVRSALAELI